MKILCVSDETDPMIYARQAKKRYEDVSFILSAGDLPFRYYDYMATILNKDIYYVYGNHNLEYFCQTKKNSKNDLLPCSFNDDLKQLSHPPIFSGNQIDGKVVYDQKHDLIIAGLGGSMLYNYGDSQYTERQMQRRINKLIPKLYYNKLKYGRYCDILLTHAPAFELGDGEDLCHTGFKCFLDFIEKYSPKYMLHGHVHLFDSNANRIHEHCGTQIINVYKSIVLDLDKGPLL